MKTYKIYTPWDSIIVEGTSELNAKIVALRELRAEIESAGPGSLDAEEFDLNGPDAFRE